MRHPKHVFPVGTEASGDAELMLGNKIGYEFR